MGRALFGGQSELILCRALSVIFLSYKYRIIYCATDSNKHTLRRPNGCTGIFDIISLKDVVPVGYFGGCSYGILRI